MQFWIAQQLRMAFRWPWQKKTDDVATETRDIDVPDKVYIEKERPSGNYEYSFEDPRIAGVFDSLFEGYYSCQNFMELFYALPEIFAPVHEIAKRIADANWQLKRAWNDEVDYNNENFNRLFSQPNPLISFKDFVYQAVCFEILTGKQFFFKNRPDFLPDEFGSIITWWNLPAHRILAELKDNVDPYTATSVSDFVSYYRQSLNGQVRKFTPDSVLPMCNMSLRHLYNPNRAVSLLKGAEKAIRNLIPVYEARGTIYIKRGALGFMVSKKSDDNGLVPLTKTEKERAVNDFDGTYGVTGHNAHGHRKSPIGITDVPLDFVRTAMSIQELQPFEETLADAVAIYAVLRVPRHLVPSKDSSTFSNAAADMKSFYSDVIIPMAKRLAEAWTTFLKLDQDRRYIYPDFSHVDVLQDNRKEKAQVDQVYGNVYLQRFTSGVCTLNDWIVANGDKKSPNPLYDKKIYEMDAQELETVKSVINLKAQSSGRTPGAEQPVLE